ncbi:hypothetical protein AYI69_g11354 [Smittium culicis]|uniref:Uncharacterized protein n=1 Tax=Smittium culicis TaxID=133412 RepID=A0A1R1WZ94_9FUNG|nr:hypothetical protein AYI69_g11354 [Smittium culicis]
MCFLRSEYLSESTIATNNIVFLSKSYFISGQLTLSRPTLLNPFRRQHSLTYLKIIIGEVKLKLFAIELIL